MAEIRKGIEMAPDPNRRARLELFYAEVAARFEGRIISFDLPEAQKWGELFTGRKSLPVMDSLIAATALHHNLTLVTRNEADFEHMPVPVHNPWSDPEPIAEADKEPHAP